MNRPRSSWPWDASCSMSRQGAEAWDVAPGVGHLGAEYCPPCPCMRRPTPPWRDFPRHSVQATRCLVQRVTGFTACVHDACLQPCNQKTLVEIGSYGKAAKT